MSSTSYYLIPTQNLVVQNQPKNICPASIGQICPMTYSWCNIVFPSNDRQGHQLYNDCDCAYRKVITDLSHNNITFYTHDIKCEKQPTVWVWLVQNHEVIEELVSNVLNPI